MSLKEIRKKYAITQKEAAICANVPLRTYIRYETNADESNLKYQRIEELIKNKYEINETNGVYKVEEIKSILNEVFSYYKNDISFCFLFGSYSKGYSTSVSDIDLCVDTSLSGLSFVGFVERIRESLRKEVDVIRFSDLKNNMELIGEIMKDGIKIYG